MDKYKLLLGKRITILTIIVLLAVAMGVYDVFFAKESLIFGFQTGLTTALGLMSAALIIQYRAILKSDTKLKLQYNKENDERHKTIRTKSGMPMLLITSVIMIIAGIIAGYFNTTVFITLICAALLQMLIGVVVKFVYMKKM